MSDKENLDKLATLESSLSASLEKKKSELTATKGGVSATKEILKNHKEFLEKYKLELKELVSKNNLNQEVAQYVSVWLNKTTKHIEEYLDMLKSARDIKTGEIITIDNVIKEMTKTVEVPPEESVTKNVDAPQYVPVTNVSNEKKEVVEQKFFSVSKETEAGEKPKKKRGRPDQVGKIGETVKRIKESKLKKNQ